jgi:membrane dipeptidase
MGSLGIVLDVSHMSEQSYYQAMDHFPGNIIASHSNPRQLAVSEYPERALSDEQIIRLAERDGVIGVVPYNRFLKTLWRPLDGKHAVTVKRVAEAVDIICQLTGSSSHAGIGSNFDGGFGAESIPAEMDTVADLRLIGNALAELGYSEEDIERVLRGNWMKILRRGLPI